MPPNDVFFFTNSQYTFMSVCCSRQAAKDYTNQPCITIPTLL